MVAFSGEPFPFQQNGNEALNFEDKEFWTAAMQEEMDSHERMKTWGPPIDLPKGATSTKTKFLFSVKAINLSQSEADIASKAHKQVLGGDGGE